jgi:hypothetical protein
MKKKSRDRDEDPDAKDLNTLKTSANSRGLICELVAIISS